MAIKGIDMGLITMVLVAMLWNGAMAQIQSSCTTAIMNLSPCLSYVTGNSSTPSSSCCSQLSSTVQSSPQCLCQLLNGGGAGALGVAINQTLALALPGACNVQTPPTSQCNAPPAGAAAAPVSSPTESPTDSSSNLAPNARLPSDSPAGTGSKTVPSTFSDGSIARTPIFSVLFLVFMASWASTATRF